MSADLPGEPPEAGDRVRPVRVEEEMEQSYIDYAMSVIVGRALPDARDGLKPVQRRILYAMHEAGITASAGHRKCSNIVGDTMGDYHPHGDDSIYDALARMAQDFSLRYPLVDGQGNFGSMDGDPPAAMRYTEARMSPLSEELLRDIEKDTVDFEPNYDDRLEEPSVLPAAVPNLLLNGASGIAVGMSTNLPPHNLGEVVDAAVHLLENPDCTVADLMEYVQGPDFPTGANIVGREGVREAYETGRGKLRVRAEMDVDEEAGRIVVTELPYQENKARRIERIAEDVTDGRIEGIADLRDESDREGTRVVVELKRGANAEVVRNQLLEHHLEQTYSVISLALVDGQPRVLNLKELLSEYVEHRKEVVRRRSEHDLGEAEERAHVLEGRLTALENAEAVVDLVRESEDRDAAKDGLQERFDLSERQADHVVRMQLGSLTSMEAAEVEEEYESVTEEIERLETILEDESELRAVVREELREVEERYDDERRTTFVEDTGDVTDEDLIPEEEVLVVVTEDDYVKRMPADRFDPQGRGGKGIIGADVKESDRVSTVFRANTHDYLLCFTNHGQVYQLKTYEVPEMSRTARGKSAVNLLKLDDGEEITAVVGTEDFEEGEYLTMVTRNGYVKRTAASEFGNVLSTGIIATRLEDGDALVDVVITDGDTDLVVASEGGSVVRLHESEIRPQDRNSRGVRGISLHEGDAVAGVATVRDDQSGWLLTVTSDGTGKRTPLGEYRRGSRAGRGTSDRKLPERGGPVHAVETVEAGDHLVLMTERGQIMRTRVDDVSVKGRDTIGVNVIDVEEGDRLASVDVLSAARRDATDAE